MQSSTTSTKYLTNLTPLRGLAAILTVIYHVDLMIGGGGGALIKYKDSMVFSRMYLMVDFFFILSGFIMCHVYSKWFMDTVTTKQFKQFTVARFARVYPMHFVTLIYTILLFYVSAKLGIAKVPVIQITDTGYSIFTNILLLHSMNLHNWFSWNHASWSISTEWWAYMVFPFLVKPVMQLKPVGILIAITVCFIGYLSITFLLIPLVTIPPEIPFVKIDPSKLSVNVAYQFGFLRCLCGFVLGMAMYQGYKAGWAKKILGNGYLFVVLAIGLFGCMHLSFPDIITISFFPLLLLSGAYGSMGLDKFFATKPLQRLGDWSFSIYLVHQPLLFTLGSIISFLNPPNPGIKQTGPPPQPSTPTMWLICLVFICITLLVSFVTYQYIEVPARNLINGRYKKKVMVVATVRG